MGKIEIKIKLYMAVFEKLAVEAKNSGAIWFKPRFSFFIQILNWVFQEISGICKESDGGRNMEKSQ